MSMSTGEKSLKSTKENSEKCSVRKEGTANDITDFLIVQKIPEYKDSVSADKNFLSIDELAEKELLSEDYEAIVKKQLQMLQADDRGQKAISSEIAKIKKLQEKKSEVLNAKRRVLEAERERARKIASLPPPLPRSVKTLLKEMDKKESAPSEETVKDDKSAQFKGLQGTAVTSKKDLNLISDYENKENMLSRDEIREKKLLEAEREMKARQRYNEALKKDRLKQEHAETLKQIHIAEQANRKQHAKSISSKGGIVPCPLSDKLLNNEKQTKMEDAVEKVYKHTKEHVIEDLDGYEDLWEMKYQNIDSNVKSKMIECVPPFVKENYSYLLQDESEYHCGKRFSGLDESFDELNMAYIESPIENITSIEEIDAAISQLDKMRTETNEVYEKEYKPLLEKGDRQSNLVDKCVETHLLKQPTEHKSTDNCVFLFEKVPCVSQSIQVDISKDNDTNLHKMETGSKSQLHKKTIKRHFPRTDSTSEQLIPEIQIKWKSPALDICSSSSYFSLPSNHGIPDICKFCDSPECKLPIAETHETQKMSKAPKQSDLSAHYLPQKTNSIGINTSPTDQKDLDQNNDLATKLNEIQITKSLSETEKTTIEDSRKKLPFTHLIKQVADKYLKNKYSSIPLTSDHDIFESPEACNSIIAQNIFPHQEEKNKLNDNINKNFFDLCHDDKLSFTEQSFKSEFSDHSEHKLIKRGLNKKIMEESKELYFSPASSLDKLILISSDESSPSTPKITSDDEKDKISAKHHEYHELSTIPEIDSALANDTVPSILRSFDSVSLKKSVLHENKDIQHNIDVSSASLIDIPHSDVSDLAKNIKFIKVKSKPGTQISVQQPKDLENFTTTHSACISSQVEPQTPKLSPSLCTISIDSSDVGTPHSVKSVNSFSSSSADLQKTPYSSSFQNFLKRPPYLTNIDTPPKYFEDISSIKQTGRVKYHGGFETSHFPSKCSEIESVYKGQQNKVPVTAFPPNDDKKLYLSQSSTGSFKAMTPHSYISSSSDQTVGENKCNSKKFQFHGQSLKPNHLTGNSWSDMESPIPATYFSSPSQNSLPSVTINEHVSIPIQPTHSRHAKSISPNKGKSQNMFTQQFQNNVKVPKGLEQVDNLTSVTLHSRISLPHNKIQSPDKKSDSEQNFEFLSPCSYLSSPTDSAQTDYLRVTSNVSNKVSTTEALKYQPVTFKCKNLPTSQSIIDYQFVAGDNPQLPKLKNLSQNYMTELNTRSFDLLGFREKLMQNISKDYKVAAQACTSDFFVPSTSQDFVKLLKAVDEPEFKFSTPQIFKADHYRELELLKSRNQLQTPTISDSSNYSSAIHSASKSSFQPTPVKSFEDLIEETGITDTPDLTLINSELTLRPGSPDKLKVSSSAKSIISKVPFPNSKSNFVHKTPSELFVPASNFEDSPSMISFLKHELSCLSDPTPEASPVTASEDTTPKTTPKKLKGLSKKKTPGKEYKSRTKRLWENLEEVKSRKKMEARKEEMEKNRQRVKAFVKKLSTPKSTLKKKV